MIGDCAVYLVEPPMEGSRYVVAMTVILKDVTCTTVYEGNAKGHVVRWMTLAGGRGTETHADAFAEIGYTLGDI